MLPDGWSKQKLSDVCQFLNGRAYNKDELLDEGKYTVLRVGNFFTNENWYYSDLELEENKYCDNGDLLYAWSASFAPKIWTGEKVIYHYHIWKIITDINLVDKFYLYYFLEWDVDNIKSSVGNGSTMIHITKGSIEQRPFYLPPLQEQKRVAEILGSVDAAIEATKTVIGQTKTVKQGLLQSLLTRGIGHTKFKDSPLGEIPDGWSQKTLGEVCVFLNGKAYNKDELLSSGKYPVLRVGNFFTNDSWYYSDLELDENKYCDNGDLLYAWSASFAPKIWNGGKVIYHYHIWKILTNEQMANKDFLYYFLEWDVDNIKATQGNGSTMIHITKGAIEQRSVNVPPLPEQKRIAEVLGSVDAAIEEGNTKLSTLRALKKGLMNDLLTGKVRVAVPVDVPANNVVPFTLTSPVDAVRKHAVLSAEITAQLYQLPTFGATKREKLTDLVVRHVGLDETTDRQAARHAAGSYDPKARREIDETFEREKWFSIRRDENAVRFTKGTAFGDHKAEFDEYFGQVKQPIQKVINLLRDYPTQHCEIIDTLYTAWNDFLIDGKTPTETEIIDEVLTNWHESKQAISRQIWREGLAWMKARDFVPSGRGRSTKPLTLL